MGFQADIEEHEGCRVVVPRGELDAFVSPDLKATLATALEQLPPRQLVVDLSATPFLDSSALGVLVGVIRSARKNGGVARIVLPATPARKIFEITGLDRLDVCFDSRAVALEAARIDAGRD